MLGTMQLAKVSSPNCPPEKAVRDIAEISGIL